MDEIRIGQIVILKTAEMSIEGIVDCVELDRVGISYFKRDETKYKSLNEGDVLCVDVHTKSGIKKMESMVIDSSGSKLIIENAPTIAEVQNRQNVRAKVSVKIFIQANDTLYPAQTLDLSAGGIKFELINNIHSLDNNNEIKVRFIDTIFKDEFTMNAMITKILAEKIYVAQFENNSESVLKIISSFCMGNMD